MKWLRVQRNTMDSLFAEPLPVFIVLAKLIKAQVDISGNILEMNATTELVMSKTSRSVHRHGHVNHMSQICHRIFRKTVLKGKMKP